MSAATTGDIKGQMALFDFLVAADDVSKVVDLGQGSFDQFFEVAQPIGLAEEALRRSIAPTVLYVLKPEPAAIARYRMLRDLFPNLTLTAGAPSPAGGRSDGAAVAGAGARLAEIYRDSAVLVCRHEPCRCSARGPCRAATMAAPR